VKKPHEASRLLTSTVKSVSSVPQRTSKSLLPMGSLNRMCGLDDFPFELISLEKRNTRIHNCCCCRVRGIISGGGAVGLTTRWRLWILQLNGYFVCFPSLFVGEYTDSPRVYGGRYEIELSAVQRWP